SSPAMKWRAGFDSPYPAPGPWEAVASPPHSGGGGCVAAPDVPRVGVGMNVGDTPRSWATSLAAGRDGRTVSGLGSAAGDTRGVAEHPRDGRVLTPPRQDLEGVRVGHSEHVRLLDPAVALDRGAVEGHPLVERDLELGRSDREALEVSEDVGEPEAHEPHPALL